MAKPCEPSSSPALVLVLGTLVVLYACPTLSAAEPTLTNITSSRMAAKDYSDTLAMSMQFYEAQKSGNRKAASRMSGIRINWRGDALLKGDGDLSGGFFDAGDHVKFSLPMGYTLTALAWGVLEFPAGYRRAQQMPAILAHLKHGADYILSCYDESEQKLVVMKGNPYEDHARWTSPEVLDPLNVGRESYYVSPSNPGTEVACEFAAALAAIAEVLDRYGSSLRGGASRSYIQKLTRVAKSLYEFGETYRGSYSNSVPLVNDFYRSWSGEQDELAWGAAWLAVRTGDDEYKTKAMNYYSPPGGGWTMDWDNKMFGVSFLLYDLAGATSIVGNQAQRAIEENLNHWMNNVPRLDNTLRILTQWGSNRHAATASFLSTMWFKRSGQQEFLDFAKSQIDYMLGDNSRRFSYVIGFGSNYPQYPHHRAAHGSFSDNIDSPTATRHILHGALVGGHKDASVASYSDSRRDFVTNEVACDYNAGFSGVLAGLISTTNGRAGRPGRRESVGQEISVRVSTDRRTASSSVDIDMVQMTGWPPRKVPLTLRYYLSLGNLPARQVEVSLTSGSNSVKVSPSLRGSGNNTYALVSWPVRTGPFPGTGSDSEARVSFTVSSKTGRWDGRSDDRSSNPDNIPVYQGRKVLRSTAPPLSKTRPSSGLRGAPPALWTPPKPSSWASATSTEETLKFTPRSSSPGGFIADVSGAKPGNSVEILFNGPVKVVNVWKADLIVSEPHHLVFKLKSNANSFSFETITDTRTTTEPSMVRII